MGTQYDELYATILNTRYLQQFMQALRKMITVVYEEPFDLQTRASQLLVPPLHAWFVAQFPANPDRQLIKATCEDLLAELGKAQSCVCDVPRPMRAAYYEAFVQSVRSLSGNSRLLVDVRVVPELLGGIRFTYNGLTYDFSIYGDFMRHTVTLG